MLARAMRGVHSIAINAICSDGVLAILCIRIVRRENMSIASISIRTGLLHHSSMGQFKQYRTEAGSLRLSSYQSNTRLGLLCVTCTDLAVLATNNFPEKW
jgi:hypothetical protein